MSDDRTSADLVFRALASPVRREILWLVWDVELPAGEIAAACSVSAATVSGHLGILRDAGLVNVQVEGTFRRYRARTERLRELVGMLTPPAGKWTPARAAPADDDTVRAATAPAVVVAVEIAVDPSVAFASFTDADTYSRWLGTPVTLVDGRFAATMPWGTRVRGHYEHVVAPSLIVMAWDFDDVDVPLPGAQLRAYAHFGRAPSGCRIEIAQLTRGVGQARFLQHVWTVLLGQLAGFLSDR